MKRPGKSKSRRTKGRPACTSAERKLELGVAAPWPVFECLISEWWHNTGNLTEILISKDPPFGGVVSCFFLVDLGCIGPKQAFVTQFRTRAEYEREFRSLMTSRNPMIHAEYSLSAKIIRESIAYSRKLGFELDQGVQRALNALGSLHAADESREEIPLGGSDGKPLYMAGPHDDIDSVMGTLVETCGHGNFHSTIPETPIPRGSFD